MYRPRLNSGEYDLVKSFRNSNVVGIIGDRHAPFTHPDYFKFVYEVFNKFQVNEIVDIGDDIPIIGDDNDDNDMDDDDISVNDSLILIYEIIINVINNPKKKANTFIKLEFIS